jgi:GH25 family lysozyme M1 (1,4-beta-N-acetylmuramidase)
MTRAQGIDVSGYQPRIDWHEVAASGVDFAIVKVSEGLHSLNAHAAEQIAGARSVGLLWGVYAYAHPGQGRAADQVDALWSHMGDTTPHILALDLETSDGLDASAVVDFAVEWVAHAIDAFGRSPWLYTFPSFEASCIRSGVHSALLASCPLWMAHYNGRDAETGSPIVPAPWSEWTAWQYDGKGKVPGVAGDCDRSVFNGDVAALRRHCGLPEAT